MSLIGAHAEPHVMLRFAYLGKAAGTENLLPPIMDAVTSYATLGEICTALRDVFGDYHAPTAV